MTVYWQNGHLWSFSAAFIDDFNESNVIFLVKNNTSRYQCTVTLWSHTAYYTVYTVNEVRIDIKTDSWGKLDVAAAVP